jgi:hypothetical protein
MWPMQLAFFLFIVLRTFLSSLTPCNTSNNNRRTVCYVPQEVYLNVAVERRKLVHNFKRYCVWYIPDIFWTEWAAWLIPEQRQHRLLIYRLVSPLFKDAVSFWEHITCVIYERTCAEHWWNDNDRGKIRLTRTNLSQLHFDHHKSHTHCPGIDSRSYTSRAIYYS